MKRSLLLILSFVLFNSMAIAADDEMGCLFGDCVNGRGTLRQETNLGITHYRGAFVNGIYQGYGRLTNEARGTVYKGNFRNGDKQGRGVYWDNDNNIYLGQWDNNRRNGSGLQAYRVQGWSEDKYTEDWLSRNAENYQGEFKNDAFSGDGTYRWADGTRYIGEWAANKKHGVGYFDYGTGNRSDRVFKFDERVYEPEASL